MKLLPKQAAALDKYFNTGGHFERLLAYAKLGHDPNWVREHFEREAKAEVIKIVEHSIVPGLFQTEDYIRAGFKAGGIKDIESGVASRVARQAVLIRPNPPLVQAILGQSVIDTPVGGAEVMRAQLSRLIELSELDNMLIRVIPRSAGFYAGSEGAFKLLTVEGKDVAYAEAFGGGRLVMDAAEARTFSTWYDRLSAEALTRRASRDLIKEVMESMR